MPEPIAARRRPLRTYAGRLKRVVRTALGLPPSRYKFTFRDRWSIAGSLDEVARLFFDTPNISRWWPQAASIDVGNHGEPTGRNRAGRSRLKGFLPYRLDVAFRVVD